MSAFTVTEKHINALVSYLSGPQSNGFYWNGKRYDVRGDEDKVGQILWDENFRSVNHRYNEDTKAPIFRWKPMQRAFTPVEIIKLCHCLDYQSCETDDYEQTKAHAIIQSIESKAMHNLPGYEEAKWCLD